MNIILFYLTATDQIMENSKNELLRLNYHKCNNQLKNNPNVVCNLILQRN